MVTRQRNNKDKTKTGKVVWRISASAPLGEYVRAEPESGREPPAEAKDNPTVEDGPPEVRERGWYHSTHELTHGVEMSEEPLDTLPDDLFDLFVKKTP
jgi:hypothetical protein